MFKEELVEDEMKAGDSCPCGRFVFLHDRQIKTVSASSASSSSLSSDISQFNAITKVASKCASWRRGQSCVLFLNKVTQVLHVSPIPKLQWYKIFTYLIDDAHTNYRESSWVTMNIVDKQLD